MKLHRTLMICFSTLALLGCGGGGGDSASPSAPPSADVSISPLSLTIDGKQFGEPSPSERVSISYNREVVSLVNAVIQGDAKFEGRNVFSLSSDSSNSFVDIMVDNSDIEGGTYTDRLILTPTLLTGPDLPSVTVNLTFIQEATPPLTSEINDPDDVSVEITENGPAVRVAASVITGPTIRWEVQPFRYIADNTDAVTIDPGQGTGSEQIEVVITPTATLVNDVRQSGPNMPVFVGLQDIDHPGNFTELEVQISIAE